jgi:SAM-dependent methyltransferase
MSGGRASAPLAAVGAFHGRAVFSRRVRVLSERLAPLLPAGRVLDVGCGDGNLAKALLALRPDLVIEGYDVLERTRAEISVTRFDGTRLPVADGSAAAALLVDVLHHADDAVALLAECARAAAVVVVKDHLMRSWLDERVLAFMDWVGNAPHGVVLPYRYFSPESWPETVGQAGLKETARSDVPGLYPFPFSLVFGRGLHFTARLERR